MMEEVEKKNNFLEFTNTKKSFFRSFLPIAESIEPIYRNHFRSKIMNVSIFSPQKIAESFKIFLFKQIFLSFFFKQNAQFFSATKWNFAYQFR